MTGIVASRPKEEITGDYASLPNHTTPHSAAFSIKLIKSQY